MLNKPISTKWYKSKKPPNLQIKILKLITSQGELSKSRINRVLDSNYSDISDAMDALAENDRQLIKFSHKTGGRRPEKFYKITEDGLRALLSINITSKEDIIITSSRFWRGVLLLSVSSKPPISDKELDNYFRQFEKSSLGHSATHGSFFQSYFFDIMLDNWLRNLSKNFTAQKVIECLAIKRNITLDELIKYTGLEKDKIIVILHNHTIQANFSIAFTNRFAVQFVGALLTCLRITAKLPPPPPIGSPIWMAYAPSQSGW